MSSKVAFKLIIVLVALVEFFLLWDGERYGTGLAVGAIILWIVKDLVQSYYKWTSYSRNTYNTTVYGKTYNEYDYDYYLGGSSSTDYSRWMPKSCRYSTEKENNKLANMLLKPNTSIVFEDDEKTKLVNERKEAFIKNPIDFTKYVGKDSHVATAQVIDATNTKPIALLPAPQEATTNADIPLSTDAFDKIAQTPNTVSDSLFIENTHDISQHRKDVYDSIIRFLALNQLNVGNIRTFLENIPHIDIFEQGKMATIFCKNIELISKLGIKREQLINAVQMTLGKDWQVSYAEYLPVTISDYYLKK